MAKLLMHIACVLLMMKMNLKKMTMKMMKMMMMMMTMMTMTTRVMTTMMLMMMAPASCPTSWPDWRTSLHAT